jgi:hypothetical protein
MLWYNGRATLPRPPNLDGLAATEYSLLPKDIEEYLSKQTNPLNQFFIGRDQPRR